MQLSKNESEQTHRPQPMGEQAKSALMGTNLDADRET
jgi:hypothetical protein